MGQGNLLLPVLIGAGQLPRKLGRNGKEETVLSKKSKNKKGNAKTIAEIIAIITNVATFLVALKTLFGL